jgi:hypothetical protein
MGTTGGLVRTARSAACAYGRSACYLRHRADVRWQDGLVVGPGSIPDSLRLWSGGVPGGAGGFDGPCANPLGTRVTGE